MTSPPARTITLHTPTDLVALAATTMGFRPEDSMVMVSFGAQSLHARLDLPGPHDLADAVEALLAPCLRHHVERVAFVAFSDDPTASAGFAAALQRRFTDEGIEVLDVLHADGHVWRRQRCGEGGAQTHPYDVSTHPLAVAKILEGAVPSSTRQDLEASVAADPVARMAVADALPGLGIGQTTADQTWALRRVADLVPLTGPADQARLLCALTSIGCRDLAWMRVTPDNAAEFARFWTAVVRAAPPGLVAPAASLLAFSAWLSGNGALAWCGVDRALDDDPDYSLAQLIAQLLEAAISPRQWSAFMPEASGLAPA